MAYQGDPNLRDFTRLSKRALKEIAKKAGEETDKLIETTRLVLAIKGTDEITPEIAKTVISIDRGEKPISSIIPAGSPKFKKAIHHIEFRQPSSTCLIRDRRTSYGRSLGRCAYSQDEEGDLQIGAHGLIGIIWKGERQEKRDAFFYTYRSQYFSEGEFVEFSGLPYSQAPKSF